MKLEIHLIQSFGPSCLNRDDTNSPKDCYFGDKRRARISSQCFKRAMRGYFRKETQVPVGERTKRLRDELVPRLAGLEPAESIPYAVDAFIDAYYAKNDSKKPEHASVLLFLSQAEMDTIAQVVREQWDDLQKFAGERAKKMADIEAKSKKKPKVEGEAETEAEPQGDGKYKDLPKPKADKAIVARLENAALSADIALFGRMLAEHTEHKVEGAAQVAHAISTHAVTQEFDFFSAVDDLNTDDSGAGMLGVTGYNAACFYRYALVDFDALVKNLKGDHNTAMQAVEAFCEAFVKAIPGGKQNSMAAQNLPDMGFFVVRDNGAPCSLVNAFVNPVRPDKEDGLIQKSVDELAKYWKRYASVYGEDGITAKSLFTLGDADKVAGLAAASSLKASITTALSALAPQA